MKVYIGPYPKMYNLSFKYKQKLYGKGEVHKKTNLFNRFIIFSLSIVDNVLNTFKSYDDTRKVKVEVNDEDVWSADITMSYIILEVLKKYKDSRIGYSITDIEDVPDNMKDSDGDIRWAYIVDEMIWTFENIANENSILYVKDDYKEFEERLDNGLRLFGKYYRRIWN